METLFCGFELNFAYPFAHILHYLFELYMLATLWDWIFRGRFLDKFGASLDNFDAGHLILAGIYAP